MKTGYAGMLALAALLAATAAAGAASPVDRVCPMPREGLTSGAPDVDARAESFTAEDQAFRIDVYSAFAPQRQAAGADFCVRYEVENRSRTDILVFDWPLAGMAVRALRPGPSHRVSLVRTGGPAKPALGDTTLYAFKSTTIPSKAYKVGAAASPLRFVADLQVGGRTVEPAPGEPVFAPPSGALPLVAAQFSGDGARVGAVAGLKRDGDSMAFIVGIDRNHADFPSTIIAPFTAALGKAETPAQIAGLVKEFRSAPLAMEADQLVVDRTFRADGDPGRAYLIQQPITFVQGDATVCFLSPAYSPVDLPPDLLACR